MRRKTTSYLRTSAEPFLDYLDQWYSKLPMISMLSILQEHPAAQTAILCVDVVNGFCKKGNLASERVGAIVQSIVRLFKNAERNGIEHFVLPEDNHPADSPEFSIYPPHCVIGSEESQTVTELMQLPFSSKFTIIRKKTINPGIEENVHEWLEQNRQIKQFIVVGDCTDICIHQLAMFLKIDGVARGEQLSIVVPANCVDTFDIPIDPSGSSHVNPHPADLLHRIFLYHMHLNGIRIVAEIE